MTIFNKVFSMLFARVICFFLLCTTTLISCRSYKMIDGRARPVYFTADSSVFTNSDYLHPVIGYDDLNYLTGNFTNTVVLKKDGVVTALITEPTFFSAFSSFLVYPGERILVREGKDNNYIFSKINGSRRRNRELAFFTMFTGKDKCSFIPVIENASLDTILQIEKRLINEIPEFDKNSQRLFDSLSNAFKVNKKFRRLTKNYIQDNHGESLHTLYEIYKDTLLTHGLYEEKNRQLLSGYFSLSQKVHLLTKRITFNELANQTLPYKIHPMSTQEQFTANFDTADHIFKGLSKDYLLSQIMYRAYVKRIQIPPDYVERYNSLTEDKSFKNLVNKIRLRQETIDRLVSRTTSDGLIGCNSNQLTSMEKINEEQKGRILLLDFWTSWCIPCKADLPYLDSLKQKYNNRNVVVLQVSLDVEIEPWRKAVLTSGKGVKNNYLMINPKISNFVQSHHINTIPRYMLIDREGKIVDSDSPGPGNQAFTLAIQKLVKQPVLK